MLSVSLSRSLSLSWVKSSLSSKKHKTIMHLQKDKKGHPLSLALFNILFYIDGKKEDLNYRRLESVTN